MLILDSTPWRPRLFLSFSGARTVLGKNVIQITHSLPGLGVNGAVSADDPYDLARFVQAQQGSYAGALDELRAGAKRGHWIWFVFPQLRGLGRSATAEKYGIRSLEEARAYLAHPVLGPRLRECASVLATHAGRSATDILGYPDDLKVRSSMTLFSRAADGDDRAPLRAVLDAFYDGRDDPVTLELLTADSG